ncbi:MAG: replication initiator protein A [Campylobacter sp.]|uniref:hypothetical protein n=1 Tax=Campylobacter sp. TaxID=205 RepID=UPI002AA8F9AC|nr:hypothetical protein [Campylobacter sp.]MCI7587333.1 replication initiator protein A [Campylobacter sp.]
MSYFKYYFDTSDLKLSLGAEKLLNIFRDRYELSAKTGFTGKNGNVVFLIKMTEIAELLGKTERTAQRVLNELREKGLVFTQKRQSGILEFSLINNFPHDKNVSFQTDKNVSFQTDKNVSFQTDKNGKMIHISQTKQARLTKPNARMRTKGSEQAEANQTQLSEATSRHSFSRAELGNSRIPSGAQGKTQAQSQAPSQTQTQEKTQNQTPSQTQAPSQDKPQTQTQTQTRSQAQTQTQDKPQAPSTARQWLGINDKPSYISEQTWQDFCAYKRERRHNFTATGKKAFFAKLDEIQAKSNACESAIKNTMANGWQGVFMPSLDNRQGQVMKPAQMVDALQEWLSDRQAQVIESQAIESIHSEQGEQALPQALPSERRA